MSPAYNADNQDKRFTFDGAGNPTAYQGSTFSFDPEDRLTGIGSPTFSARYDGDGLRAWKQGSGAATYFLNGTDGQPVLEETYSGTSASLSAANGFAADGLRARGQGNVVTDYLYDPQGSVVQRQSSGGYNTG